MRPTRSASGSARSRVNSRTSSSVWNFQIDTRIKIFGKISDPEIYFIADMLENMKSNIPDFEKNLQKRRVTFQYELLLETHFDFFEKNVKSILHSSQILQITKGSPLIIANENTCIPHFCDLLLILEQQFSLDLLDFRNQMSYQKEQDQIRKKYKTFAKRVLQSMFKKSQISQLDEPPRFKYAFFDFRIEQVAGILPETDFKVIIELYNSRAPQTCKNFLELCKGTTNLAGKKIGYTGSKFQRLHQNFYIQGGDIDGKGGQSIFGQVFQDEVRFMNHSLPGVVGFANQGGKNSNGSQFYITFCSLRDFDSKYVAFSNVIKGMQELRKINKRIPGFLDNVYLRNSGIYNFNTKNFKELQREFLSSYLQIIMQKKKELPSLQDFHGSFNFDLVNLISTIQSETKKCGNNQFTMNIRDVLKKLKYCNEERMELQLRLKEELEREKENVRKIKNCSQYLELRDKIIDVQNLLHNSHQDDIIMADEVFIFFEDTLNKFGHSIKDFQSFFREAIASKNLLQIQAIKKREFQEVFAEIMDQWSLNYLSTKFIKK